MFCEGFLGLPVGVCDRFTETFWGSQVPEEDKPVPSCLLCVIHRQIRMSQQLSFTGGVFRIDGNANAGPDRDQLSMKVERLVNGGENSSGDGCNLMISPCIVEENDKFIASDPVQVVVAPQKGKESLGESLEQRISHLMAKSVVDGFKSVKVQKKERQEVFPIVGGFEPVVDLGFKKRAVRKLCQWIVVNFALGYYEGQKQGTSSPVMPSWYSSTLGKLDAIGPGPGLFADTAILGGVGLAALHFLKK